MRIGGSGGLGRGLIVNPLSLSFSASQWMAAMTFMVSSGNDRNDRSKAASVNGWRLPEKYALRHGPSAVRSDTPSLSSLPGGMK
jgi:hypothetical protein